MRTKLCSYLGWSFQDKDSSDSDLDEVDKEKEAKKEEETTNLAQEQAKSKKKAAAVKGSPLIAKKADATKKPTKPVSAKALKGAKVPMPAPRPTTTTTTTNGKGLKPTSPSGARSASPPAGPSSSLDKKKRKLDGDDAGEEGPSKKAARAEASGSPATSSEPADDSMLITEAEVIALLKSKPQVTTRDVINDLKRKLRKDARNKGILAQIVKKVASSHEGVLTLKEGF